MMGTIMPRDRKTAGRRLGAPLVAAPFDPLSEAERDALADALMMSRSHFDAARGEDAPLADLLERAIADYVAVRVAVPLMPTEREVAARHREILQGIFDLMAFVAPPPAEGLVSGAVQIAADAQEDLVMFWQLAAALRRHGEAAVKLEAAARQPGPKRRNDDLVLAAALRAACLSAGIGWTAGSRSDDDRAAERPAVRLLVACLVIAIERLRRSQLPAEAIELAIDEARGVLMLAPAALANRIRSAARADCPP
jgi:hypothetical protein